MEEAVSGDTAVDNLYGSLHKYANPVLIAGEKTAWQMSVLTFDNDLKKRLSAQV